MRKEYEMTEEQQSKLLDFIYDDVPLIALHCGTPANQQERANIAWQSLGQEMGFEYMTVRPVRNKNELFFTALPTIKLGDKNA